MTTTIETLLGNRYEFVESGSIAANQFHAKETIHAVSHEDGEVYIPFHAVLFEYEMPDEITADPVVDANCGNV